MKIFDREGKMYQVNNVEKLFETVDVDSMLEIFESTYLSNQIYLAAEKVIEGLDDGEQLADKYPAEEMNQSLEEIKKYLVEKDQVIELQEVIDRIENYVIDVLKIKERKSE